MKKITPERLKNIALFYLERYDASSEKLRFVLKRRVKKASLEQPIPPQSSQWIEQVVSDMKRLGYVDDKRFAENLIRRYSEVGKSPSFIRSKLKLAGIDETIVSDMLEGTDELSLARLMVQKKHLGNDFQRDLARLARAGFSYEIARTALDEVIFLK